ncbi:MAG: hypothetical protein IPN95_31245 [Bacteroidetes bacterium]|nr:hypothetical protein [Bacteroidota bacterium]MBL0018253.1 hypothetical protein [Bacteroidota bacterium]MBP6721902.1 hypothetical protein [Bacteroidia bacterium]MBP8073960.1 hypothetical protein [Bacteroidia bacterium]
MKNTVKILVHNIVDTNQRLLAEQDIANHLMDGFDIVSTHTDFEMNGSNRVIILTVILRK